MDDTNFHSFYDYQQSVGEIEKYNSEGGIRRTYIRYELYNCPVDSDKAAGLVVNLKVRGFELLVGGCNAKVKSYLSSTLNSIDSILFYTGLNPGGECIKNMYIYIYLLIFVYIVIIECILLCLHIKKYFHFHSVYYIIKSQLHY